MLNRTALCALLTLHSTLACAQPTTRPPASLHNSLLANTAMKCGMANVMALGNYSGPKEAKQKLYMALTYQCLDREMPKDWKGHADARATADKNFAAAHAIDPHLPALRRSSKTLIWL